MEMDIRQQRQVILTRIVNDFSTLVSRLDKSNGCFPQRVQMAHLCALSTRSPHLINQLQETMECLERWLWQENTYEYWLSETTTVNRATLLDLIKDALVFFSVNGTEGV